MNPPVYLDHNATTPLDPRVLEEMLPFFGEMYGNAASRTHSYGWQAEEAVKIARERIANLIGAMPEEIIFTSGATESDNLAIKGVAELYAGKGDHLITLATEHKAVLDTCEYLEKIGKRVTVLGVNADGLIDLQELEAAMTAQTVLVAVMMANNEIGVIQPMKEIAEIVHRHGSILMSDATQAVGKIPVNVDELGLDLVAFSAHKMYGPKGVGALYVRRRNPRVRLAPQMHGGGHERGFRSGTLNVPGIAGLGKAAEICAREMEADALRMAGLRDRLEKSLLEVPFVTVNGSRENRLPHVSNLSFRYVDADALIMAMRGIAVSTGSACTSASIEPSHVLRALGLPDDDAYASIRFSLGRFTTEEHITFASDHVKAAIEKLRQLNPAWRNFVADKGD
jgi:cysteine desulfurase